MATKRLANWVQHQLTIAALSTDTVLTFDSVAGWPTLGDFMLRLDNPALTITEFVLVTSVNVGANQVTCVRAQETTGASPFPINSTGGNDLTAQMLTDAFVRLDTALSQTLTGPLVIPPALGGAAAATSYGSVPIKLAENLLVAIAASVTFSSIPQTFRNLRLDWYARSDTAAVTANLLAQVNGISTATYDREVVNGAGAAWAFGELLAQTSMQLSRITGATATANYFGQGEAKIKHYTGAVGNKLMTSTGSLSWGDVTGQIEISVTTGKWRTAAAPVTSLTLLPSAGNFIAGSLFTLWGEP